MRLLVTGACGFIGSNFVRFWKDAHPEDHVVALDLLTYAGVRENIDDLDVPFVHADIGDACVVKDALAEHRVDVIVNFAAESHNSYALLDPSRAIRTNVLATQQLCETALGAGVARFHHISTCEVYGDLPLDSDEKFTEDSPYRPKAPYNAGKAGGDHIVRAYHLTFGLPVTITNCCNNYGPYQFPEKVIPLFTTNALDDESVPVYASFHNRREWIHVLDHCRAVESVLLRGRIGETYNVATGVERSVDEIADAVLDTLGKPRSLKQIVEDRPGHERRYVLDYSKIHDTLGWSPVVQFEDGIRDTVKWYADHREWWEPLKQRKPIDESAWKR